MPKDETNLISVTFIELNNEIDWHNGIAFLGPFFSCVPKWVRFKVQEHYSNYMRSKLPCVVGRNVDTLENCALNWYPSLQSRIALALGKFSFLQTFQWRLHPIVRKIRQTFTVRVHEYGTLPARSRQDLLTCIDQSEAWLAQLTFQKPIVHHLVVMEDTEKDPRDRSRQGLPEHRLSDLSRIVNSPI